MSYIKINISRSRKISTKSITNSLFNQNKNPENGTNGVFFIEERKANNEVRLSILADIGSSSFIYDLNNIKEVFIFPKIWYRRSLAKQLFFGYENIPAYKSTNSESSNAPNLSGDSKSSSTNDLNELFYEFLIFMIH